MRKAACWLLSFVLCASLSGEEIIVASYNVQSYWLVDPANEHPLIDEPAKSEQAIAAVIQVLNRIKPDIVGLIEIGDESMLADLQTRLRERKVWTTPIGNGCRELIRCVTFPC